MEGWDFRPIKYIFWQPLSDCILDDTQALSMTSYIWMWEEWCVCVMVSDRRDEDWGISAFIKFVTIIF